jgi:UDP-N-acetylglucosamine acyltransferase
MPTIHPSAVVDPKAQIADDVEIGPLCVVGPQVTIGAGTRLIAQCYVAGRTTLGERNVIYPGACIGGEPQDYGYDPKTVSYVRIGNDNFIREGATIHLGTNPDSATIVGNGNFLMSNIHLAHNCKVGNDVVMVTLASAAGHVELGDGCFISGLAAIRQFCRVGSHAMMWGLSAISRDLPPYMMVNGRNGEVVGVNVVALRRRNFSAEAINALRRVHTLFYKSDTRSVHVALDKVKAEVPLLPEVQHFIDFVESSERGVLMGRVTRGSYSGLEG